MVSYLHIHVINAQLAMEMLPDIATKPDGLREREQCEVPAGSRPDGLPTEAAEDLPPPP